MLNYLKKFYLHFLIFFVFLLVVISFLFTNPYNNITKREYEEVYRNYIQYYRKPELSSNLFDIENFTYLIKPNITHTENDGKGNKPKFNIIFIITSHFNNIEVRSAMRRSYSKESLDEMGINRVFLLGITPDNKYVNQKSIEDEAERYGDILQGSFLEAYKNLTYKHVMGLKWVSEYCTDAKFVIKMDDDIIVNIRKLLGILGRYKDKKNFIAGYVLKGLQAKREKQNKWFVTREEYAPDTYPDFVSGWLYITTPSVSQKLVQLTHSFKYFWIDDVFVTGILSHQISVELLDIKKYFTDHPEYFQCCLNDLIKYKFDCDIIVGPNGGRTNLFYEFNKAFSICSNSSSCSIRSFPMNETCVGTKTLNLGRGNAVISTYNLV